MSRLAIGVDIRDSGALTLLSTTKTSRATDDAREQRAALRSVFPEVFAGFNAGGSNGLRAKGADS